MTAYHLQMVMITIDHYGQQCSSLTLKIAMSLSWENECIQIHGDLTQWYMLVYRVCHQVDNNTEADRKQYKHSIYVEATFSHYFYCDRGVGKIRAVWRWEQAGANVQNREIEVLVYYMDP